MSSRWLLGLVASISAVLVTPVVAETRHVVELFTSQGCSSCPPADAVLSQLAKRPDVLALGFHVDYWDRLGWKDTLGSAAFSERQRAYASRSDGQVYTPQAVVNGARHTVGSSKPSIDNLMSDALPVDVSIGKAAREVTVGSGTGAATLWRIDFTRRAAVPIKRGENRGKTVTYVNAVRGMTKLGRWNGKAARYDLGPCGARNGADDCAVILQSGGGPGKILGAARR